MTFFKKLFVFQENIRRCVCIIYDPSRADQGVLALKALKLSDSFMELYRSNNFTGEKYEFSSGCNFSLSWTNCFLILTICLILWNRLREKNLSWKDIFVEIPVSFLELCCNLWVFDQMIFLLKNRYFIYLFNYRMCM
jgi:hypothetical protein